MITPEMFMDREALLAAADAALTVAPMHITDHVSPLSEGGPHAYYSNGDYWWPDPKSPNGLPYIRRDGEYNPDNFKHHRDDMMLMKNTVIRLAVGYKLTGREDYAAHAVRILREFFLDEETYMEPHLMYAQAIPGLCTGRGIGVIDTLRLTDIPFAIRALEGSSALTPAILEGLRGWFSEYLTWMDTHPYGVEERDYKNNHAVCWHTQALSFAWFTGRQEMIDACTDRFRRVLLPNQMREDGGFIDELTRTRPYGYSIFVLENAVGIVHIADLCGVDLWSFTLEDGRSIRRGLEFLLPYLEDKSTWFLPSDIELFDTLPGHSSFMIFTALHEQDERYLKLFRSLPVKTDLDVSRRNNALARMLLMA